MLKRENYVCYVARDECGILCIYTKPPFKDDDGRWHPDYGCMASMYLPRDMFPEVKWEDKKPRKARFDGNDRLYLVEENAEKKLGKTFWFHGKLLQVVEQYNCCEGCTFFEHFSCRNGVGFVGPGACSLRNDGKKIIFKEIKQQKKKKYGKTNR